MNPSIETHADAKQNLFLRLLLFYFVTTIGLTFFYITAHLYFNGLGIGNIEELIIGVGSLSFIFAINYTLTKIGFFNSVVYIHHWIFIFGLLVSLQVIEFGVYNPTFYLSFTIIVSSGYFLGLKHLIWMTTLSALWLCLIYVEELVGIKVTIFPPPRLDVVVAILCALLMTGFTTYVLLRELENRTTQLENYKENLELVIEKRTAQLGDALDKAKKANTAKSVFLATMSHELRTPLNAIIGYTEMIEEELIEYKFESEAQTDVIHIKNSGRHLLNLINSILDLSKIEAGEESVDIEPVAVKSLIVDVIDFSRPLFEKSRNEAAVSIKAPDSTIIMTDRQKLYQILLNLISNANKFTQNGTIFVNFEIDSNTNWAQFIVRDTGIGIPAEKLNQLFEPFQQLDNTYNRKYEGTGLGLTISKKFCNMLDGQISAKNHPEGGAIFEVRLPVSAIQMSGDSL